MHHAAYHDNLMIRIERLLYVGVLQALQIIQRLIFILTKGQFLSRIKMQLCCAHHFTLMYN